jgi:hypothetical protein
MGIADLPRPVGYVLGGGGSLGAVQVGMLQALSEHAIAPDIVAAPRSAPSTVPSSPSSPPARRTGCPICGPGSPASRCSPAVFLCDLDITGPGRYGPP